MREKVHDGYKCIVTIVQEESKTMSTFFGSISKIITQDNLAVVSMIIERPAAATLGA